MPIRKNLAERMAAYQWGQLDTVAWSRGDWLVISLRPSPASSAVLPVGVAVTQHSPEARMLVRFADPVVWLNHVDAPTGVLIGQLLDRAERLLNHGHFVSPAPNMLVYGRRTPYQYPDAETALERAWLRHVAHPLRRPVGQALVNQIIKDLRAALGHEAAISKQKGMAMVQIGGRHVALIAANDPDLPVQEAVGRAGRALAQQSRHAPASLLILEDRANGLMAELAEVIAQLHDRLGVETQVVRPLDAADAAVAFLTRR